MYGKQITIYGIVERKRTSAFCARLCRSLWRSKYLWRNNTPDSLVSNKKLCLLCNFTCSRQRKKK